MKKYWIDNKKILITGASSGLGRELTKILIFNHNCTVIGVGRIESKFQSLISQLGVQKDKFRYFLCDVSKEETWLHLSTNRDLQDLDVLINNAGILPPFETYDKFVQKNMNTKDTKGILDSDIINVEISKNKTKQTKEMLAKEETNKTYDIKSKIDQIMNTNFLSTALSCAYLSPILQKSKTPAIINISSSAGLCALPGISLYSASKSAVKNFTECLQLEKNYYVGLICPGFTKTNIFRYQTKNSNNKLIDFISSNLNTMTKKIYRAILHKKKRCVFGFDAKCMDKLYRHFPNVSLKLFRSVLRKAHIDLFEDVFDYSSNKKRSTKK